MEELVVNKDGIDKVKLFNNVYQGKRVFITGHTGFKGSWLAIWLKSLGAEVAGYALAPSTTPNHLNILSLEMHTVLADIRDKKRIIAEMKVFQPDIVFHLAAQPLVRYSYLEPSETYETNVIGTLNVLEACSNTVSVKAVVCVTTDKVYENKEVIEGYQEQDRLGGYDPYSASKACAEILTASYVSSYFNLAHYGNQHEVLIATARGGNVIGGGDWSEDRLVPDIARTVGSGAKLEIRSPESVRPWQHVLDCLSGYLLLGERLLSGEKEFAGSWNFGPLEEEMIKVKEIISIAQSYWKEFPVEFSSSELHETGLLRLKCDKAVNELSWTPVLNNSEMFAFTFEWYKDFYESKKVSSEDQLSKYMQMAVKKAKSWACEF